MIKMCTILVFFFFFVAFAFFFFFFFLINNSRSAWPSRISMSFLSFSDNLLQDVYLIFHNSVVNFKIVHKTCSSAQDMLNSGLGYTSPLTRFNASIYQCKSKIFSNLQDIRIYSNLVNELKTCLPCNFARKQKILRSILCKQCLAAALHIM